MHTRIKIEKIAIIALLFIFVLYAFFESYKIIRGPVLEVVSPINYSEINDPFVIIEGKAKNISLISLNDRQIFIDESGVFKEKLLLPFGYTIIKVEAEDKFKKKTRQILSLYRPYDMTTSPIHDTSLLNASTSTSTEEIYKLISN